MNYPISAYSWDILSEGVAIKHMDKSAFLHHGTGVPKEMAFFFDLPEENLTESRHVTIEVDKDKFDAHIQMDNLHERFRLFWKSDFTALIKQRFPSYYDSHATDSDIDASPPRMRFQRIHPDIYSVDFLEPVTSTTTDWTDEELDAAINAYFQMLNDERHGRPYNKAEINRTLRSSSLVSRSKGSVEFRMQNISAVLQEFCHPIIQGYLPRGNIGAEVAAKIKTIIFGKKLLREEDYKRTPDDDELERKVYAILQEGLTGKPKGQLHPPKKEASQERYERDPLVKAWVLQNAVGICELCDKQGPFRDRTGRLFLEVHHVIHLAEGGADTVNNAVALCPNCHKRCHHSENTKGVAQDLRHKIDRIE